jgi:hypothetical protein
MHRGRRRRSTICRCPIFGSLFIEFPAENQLHHRFFSKKLHGSLEGNYIFSSSFISRRRLIQRPLRREYRRRSTLRWGFTIIYL